MKLIQIITQEFKNDMDKAELELETIIQDKATSVSEKVDSVRDAIGEWRTATDNFKYWDSFVQERIMRPSTTVETKEEQKDE